MHAGSEVRPPDRQSPELAAEIFALLADATRVRIVLALHDDELSVNHLADIVDKSPAAVSQHLARLRLARIVAARQDGTRVFYRLRDEHARELVAEAIFQAQRAIGQDAAHRLAELPVLRPREAPAGETAHA